MTEQYKPKNIERYLNNLKDNIIDALNQCGQLFYGIEMLPEKNYNDLIKKAQNKFISVTREVIKNCQETKDFTKEQAEKILAAAQEEEWTPQNFKESIVKLAKLAGLTEQEYIG